MINFFVCDDNEVIRHDVSEIIDKVMMKNDFQYKIHLYSDYDKNFIKDMMLPLSNKIFILDIETPSGSGIDMARKIRSKDIDSILIFLTSHYEMGPSLLDDELMFLAFISKFNNQDERLISVINKALTMIGKKQAIRFDDHGVLYTIPLSDILYITKDSVTRKSIIKTDYTEFKINKTLTELSEMLGDNFVQTHRSCFINDNRCRVMDKKHKLITFDNGETIDLLSNNFKKEVVK